jgi:4-amino-4-deoxy-L-arabinose transferase-like glycosyltransferase
VVATLSYPEGIVTSVTTDQQAYPSPAAVPPDLAARLRRLARGRGDDPRWARPGLLALLAATALLYAWGLGRSGWANSFYSAAAQAGSASWKAFFFGSSDAASFITVDKPPASLWVMDISARLFGVNAWSILLPQAAEGVAAVAVLYAAVRRWFGPAAGLASGAVLALTPAAVLMFRFNNPDALLTLLLVLAGYCLVRAVEAGGTRWLVLAGVAVGFAFLTKMLQALLVVPGLGLAYLVAAPVPLRRRVGQLLAAGLALVVSAGWWVAAVELWPASSRPYIGGSQSNSVLELIFGYNGFGRLTGAETGSVTGGPGGRGGFGGAGGRWGPTGWDRLFTGQMGGQVSWLLPAALVFSVALLWLGRRTPRTDRTRAAVLMWAGWLLVTGAVLSFARGIIHPYYTVALAPAVGALVGIGTVQLWRLRRTGAARVALAVALAAIAVWSAVLLGRTPQWHPWLRELVLVGGLAGAVLLLLLNRLARPAAMITIAVAALVGLAGPAAYALSTAAAPHAGAIPSAGPASGGFGLGPGGGRRAGLPGGAGAFPGGPGGPGGAGAFPGGPGALPGGGAGGFPGGPGAFPGGGTGGSSAGRGGRGGLLTGSHPSAAVVAALQANAGSYTWVAAAIGSNSAAGYQLATGGPVMAVGGFNGSDPAPSLQQFQQYVAAGKIHYFIGGGGGGLGGANGGSDSSRQIARWVEQSFRASTVGGTTLYDLTAPTAGTPS